MSSHPAMLLFLNIGTPELILVLAVLCLPAYFAARAVWRRFKKSGSQYAALFGALTFVLCFFATLFIIGTITAASMGFGR